jgi:ribose 5-phosphate isomerase B
MVLEKNGSVLYSIACRERRWLAMKVVIANDHAGVGLKMALKEEMEKQGHEVTNIGTDGEESTDYPDYVKEAALAVQKGEADFGIVICGTGIGASITANKFRGVYAALCYSVFTAKMARNHNAGAGCDCHGEYIPERELHRGTSCKEGRQDKLHRAAKLPRLKIAD